MFGWRLYLFFAARNELHETNSAGNDFDYFSIGLAFFGFISLTAFIYLTIREWSTMSGDKRIGKILYLGLLLL